MGSYNYRKYAESQTTGWVLRILQAVFTIILLGLVAFVIDRYARGGSVGFTMFTTVITLVYLIGVFVISFVRPGLLIIGVILIIESFLALFWFISFIAWAADLGGNSCNYVTYAGWGVYYRGVNSSSCHAAKAVIAFAIFNFIVFTISSVLFGIQVARVVINDNPAKLWQTNDSNGYSLGTPALGLVGAQSRGANYDVEEGLPPAGVEKTEAPESHSASGTTVDLAQGPINSEVEQIEQSPIGVVPNSEAR